MKKPAYLLLLVIAVLIAGCGGNGTKSSADLDSIRKADSLRKIWMADSTLWVDFKSKDLSFFNLHGHVKMMLYNGVTYEFNKQGEWTSLDGVTPFDRKISFDDPNNSFTRNANGFIMREQNWEGYSVYDWMDGMLVGKTYYDGAIADINANGHREDGYQSRMTYDYDSLGRVKTTTFCEREDGATEWSKPTTTIYKYLRNDVYGNWVLRYSNIGTDKRTIIYYDFPSVERDSLNFLPLSQIYAFKGSIGPDQRAVLILGPAIGACNTMSGSRDITFESYDAKTSTLKLILRSDDDGRKLGEFIGKISNEKGWVYKGRYSPLKGAMMEFRFSEK